MQLCVAVGLVRVWKYTLRGEMTVCSCFPSLLLAQLWSSLMVHVVVAHSHLALIVDATCIAGGGGVHHNKPKTSVQARPKNATIFVHSPRIPLRAKGSSSGVDLCLLRR